MLILRAGKLPFSFRNYEMIISFSVSVRAIWAADRLKEICLPGPTHEEVQTTLMTGASHCNEADFITQQDIWLHITALAVTW